MTDIPESHFVTETAQEQLTISLTANQWEFIDQEVEAQGFDGVFCPSVSAASDHHRETRLVQLYEAYIIRLIMENIISAAGNNVKMYNEMDYLSRVDLKYVRDQMDDIMDARMILKRLYDQGMLLRLVAENRGTR
jgi:hypothetical protein